MTIMWVVYRKCNTFKDWSIEKIVPVKTEAEFLLNFLDFKDDKEGIPKFIGLKRRMTRMEVNLRRVKKRK